jgi:hypothetical protein
MYHARPSGATRSATLVQLALSSLEEILGVLAGSSGTGITEVERSERGEDH